MTKPDYADYICPVQETGLLNFEQLDRCTADLASDPEAFAPFAISYDLHLYDGYVFAQPVSRLWQESEGVVHAFRTTERPDLFRHYAPQIFSFLEMEALRDAFWNALNTLLPRGSGELFHACICAHGVILIAEQARWVAMNHSVNPFVGFVPKGLSNHARVAHFAGLKACATALLRAQAIGHDTPLPQVRVEQSRSA